MKDQIFITMALRVTSVPTKMTVSVLTEPAIEARRLGRARMLLRPGPSWVKHSLARLER